MRSSTANLVLSLNGTRTVAKDAAGSVETDVASLTSRIHAGDEEAFRAFHQRYFDRLYQFLIGVTRGREDEAKEALQETMVRVVRYVRRFETEEVFWSWLKAVARSAARDHGRKHVRYLGLLQRFAVHVNRAADESLNSLTGLLDESLAELDPLDRQIMEGKYLQGLTVIELAAETGLTDKAVESRLLRSRRHVKESILKKLRGS